MSRVSPEIRREEQSPDSLDETSCGEHPSPSLVTVVDGQETRIFQTQFCS